MQYEMFDLGREHRDELRAEAERERLAREARKHAAASRQGAVRVVRLAVASAVIGMGEFLVGQSGEPMSGKTECVDCA